MFTHCIYVLRYFPVLHSPIGLRGPHNADSFHSSAIDEDGKDRPTVLSEMRPFCPLEGRVRSQTSLFEILGGRSGTGTGFSPITLPFHQRAMLSIYLHVAVTKTNGRSLGTSQKAKFFRKSEAVG